MIKRILLIEDDETALQLNKERLSDLGHVVEGVCLEYDKYSGGYKTDDLPRKQYDVAIIAGLYGEFTKVVENLEGRCRQVIIYSTMDSNLKKANKLGYLALNRIEVRVGELPNYFL